MNLQDLLHHHALRPAHGLPDWTMGWFKRHSISFCDGLTDAHTHVCWLQSRNFTIDLRLPRVADQPPAAHGQALREGRLADIPARTWAAWADFEGWKAPSTLNGQRLRWHTPDASLQWHDRWPEPAILHRVGDCMVEFCDSGAYVEDWRLQRSARGPLVGLHLLHETDDETGALRHVGGGWIVAGDHAALVLGRPHTPAAADGAAPTLREHLARVLNRPLTQGAEGPSAWPALRALFDFETSVASLSGGQHRVQLSTRPERIGQVLCPTDGFTWLGTPDGTGDLAHAVSAPPHLPPHLQGLPQLRQALVVDGRQVTRLFAVDTLEPQLDFHPTTACTPQAQAWMQREQATLQRYTTVLLEAHPDAHR